ncbi:MAG TPA: hypothetical protein VNC50_04770 [Planctomycetia bacterium]|nr:hypothetical protein [Planctomycetia bacterium]
MLPERAKRSAADVVRWSVILIAAAGVCGAGFYFWKYQQPAEKVAQGRFENPGRNYLLLALGPEWKPDLKRANQAGLDLALKRAEGAWVTIRTHQPKGEPPSVSELSDTALAKWRERIRDFEPIDRAARTTLSGRQAEIVTGEGTLDGQHVRGQTVSMVAGGITYQLNFEAPKEQYAAFEGDFQQARKNFQLMGEAFDNTKDVTDLQTREFFGSKYPYRLEFAAKGWKEAPELDTGSRFDDLKLADKKKLADVAVSARQTQDLAAMRDRFIETQARLYSKVTKRDVDGSPFQINGRRALRATLLATTGTGEDRFIHATFVKEKDRVYVVKCTCVADNRGTYEPTFELLAQSFEPLDRLPEEVVAERNKKSPPVAKKSEDEKMEAKAEGKSLPKVEGDAAPAKKTEMAPKKDASPAPKPADAAAKQDAKEEMKPAAKAPAKEEMKPEAKADPKKSETKKEEAKKDETKKETKDPKKDDPKKKKKSLDDID